MTIALVVEDGTGVVGANAYDTTAATAAWLTDRKYNAFFDSDDQVLHLTEATKLADQATQPYLRGWPISETQGLGWPRYGAFDRSGRQIAPDSVPSGIRYGIFLLAEEMAAAARHGRRIRTSDPMGTIAEHASGGSRIRFRREQSFEDLHPEAWRWLESALPSMGVFTVRG